MTTPTPQDIAKARDLVEDWYNAGDFFRHTLTDRIAAALAAERSRWQTECERLREALKLTEFGFNHVRCPICAGFDQKLGEQNKIHTRTCPVGLALAQPATAETTKEVMHSGMAPEGCERRAVRETSVAPPQPAPSPAGAKPEAN